MRWWCLLLVACAPLPATSLADVEFPDGFALATDRVVHVRATSSSQPAPRDAFLGVRGPGGVPLYEGSLGYALDHGLVLSVPATVGSVEARVRSPDGATRTYTVVLDDAGEGTLDLGAP